VTVALQSGRVLERTVPMRDAVELRVHDPQAAREVRPGQFFQIGVDAPHTLLRRPYSAAWADPERGDLGFIFNVVGAGSDWLARLDDGDEIDLLGPLGRGFDLDGDRPAICVAGGLGVAVFPGVVAALLARRRPITMFIGARTAAQLLPARRFAGADVRAATDDGSAGYRGPVTDLLLRGGGYELFACGPTPMLQALVQRAPVLGISLGSIQIALETPMGCGLGTCLGCAVPGRGGGYLLSCQHGPCVRADRLDWSRMTDAFHD